MNCFLLVNRYFREFASGSAERPPGSPLSKLRSEVAETPAVARSGPASGPRVHEPAPTRSTRRTPIERLETGQKTPGMNRLTRSQYVL